MTTSDVDRVGFCPRVGKGAMRWSHLSLAIERATFSTLHSGIHPWHGVRMSTCGTVCCLCGIRPAPARQCEGWPWRRALPARWELLPGLGHAPARPSNHGAPSILPRILIPEPRFDILVFKTRSWREAAEMRVPRARARGIPSPPAADRRNCATSRQ